MKRSSTMLCLGFLSLLLASRASGMEGRVTTREGQSFLGQVRFQSNAVLIANVAHARMFLVALTNLHSLDLLSRGAESFASTHRAEERAGTLDWRHADVGPAHLRGQAIMRDGSVHLRASTLPPDGGQDSLQFAFRTMRGNGEIAGRLLRRAGGQRPSQAGLMIRESLKPDAPTFFMGQSTHGGITQWRLAAGESMKHNPHRAVDAWMRLRREGDWCTAYASKDGLRWRLIDRVQLSMGKEILVGCALAGESTAQTSRALCWFDEVRSGQGLSLPGYVPKITLESGSLLAEEVAYTLDGELHFKGTTPLPNIPLHHAARLDFQWLPARWESRIQRGKRGALLSSGEFFEGDLKSLKEGTCTMSTVLFGLRQFDAHHDIVSIVLGPTANPTARDEIRTWGGSIWRGTIERLDEDGLVVIEPLLGRITIPFFTLKQVSRPASVSPHSADSMFRRTTHHR